MGHTQVVQSNLTPADIGSFSRDDFAEFNWPVLYARIRQINLFLENIEDVPFDDNAWKDRLKGEVHFLHAYFYHNLVRLYGGVPLVTKAYDLKDDFTIFRATLQESIDFVVSECDLAASLLPATYAVRSW